MRIIINFSELLVWTTSYRCWKSEVGINGVGKWYLQFPSYVNIMTNYSCPSVLMAGVWRTSVFGDEPLKWKCVGWEDLIRGAEKWADVGCDFCSVEAKHRAGTKHSIVFHRGEVVSNVCSYHPHVIRVAIKINKHPHNCSCELRWRLSKLVLSSFLLPHGPEKSHFL